jgi:hypothetical protein
MFYYLCHLYVIHALAIVVAIAWKQPYMWLIEGGFFTQPPPDGYGHNLGFIWLMWLLALVILYFPCKWYMGVRKRRQDLWIVRYI